MSIRPASATLALTAAFGCTLQLGPSTGESASNTNPGTDGTDGTDGTSGTSGVTDTASGTDTGMTTSVTPTTTESSTGEPAPEWCNGLDPAGPATLAVSNGENVPIVDGSPLPVQCGGQGSLMIPIFPHFGGFIPDEDNVGFDIILDVEGFNLGANGHFFESIGNQHDVDCAYSEPYGYDYSYAFIPIFPPDAIPDILVVDGKPGVLHVTLHSPIGDMVFDANVVLTVPPDFACGYGGYETDTDGYGSTSGGSTSGDSST